MTTIHIARHGETIWHDENRYAGSSDISLTGRGLEQAAGLAAWASGASLDRLVSSDLARAVITAQPVAAATGLELQVDSRAREVDFGRAEGLTTAEMIAEFPDAHRAFIERPASSPLPDGEPGAAAIARATSLLAELCATASPSIVLIVAHTTLARLVVCWSIGLPLDSYRRVFPRLGNCAITTLRFADGAGAASDLEGRGELLALNVPT